MDMKGGVKVIIFIVIIVVIVGLFGAYQFGTQDTAIRKVKDKEEVVQTTGEGKVTSKYLIYTERGEPLENTDTFFHGKFNSSTFYSRIDKGSCYKFDVYGFRIPINSTYRNIIGMEEVDCGKFDLDE
jgi:hypothetical protein